MSPPDPAPPETAVEPKAANSKVKAPGNAHAEEGLGREIRALITVYVALGVLAALYGAAFAPGQ